MMSHVDIGDISPSLVTQLVCRLVFCVLDSICKTGLEVWSKDTESVEQRRPKYCGWARGTTDYDARTECPGLSCQNGRLRTRPRCHH